MTTNEALRAARDALHDFAQFGDMFDNGEIQGAHDEVEIEAFFAGDGIRLETFKVFNFRRASEALTAIEAALAAPADDIAALRAEIERLRAALCIGRMRLEDIVEGRADQPAVHAQATIDLMEAASTEGGEDA